jgi:hypothetical protein
MTAKVASYRETLSRLGHSTIKAALVHQGKCPAATPRSPMLYPRWPRATGNATRRRDSPKARLLRKNTTADQHGWYCR